MLLAQGRSIGIANVEAPRPRPTVRALFGTVGRMGQTTAIVYGALNPDIVHRVERLPGPGDDIRSSAWSTNWGGKAANAAMALATWGATARLMGLPVGRDALGELLMASLHVPMLDRSWLVRTDEPTRHCIILVTPDGDRSIVCTGYEGAAWQKVPAAAWDGVDVVLVDGFGGDAAAAVATEAVRRGVPVVWLDAPDPPPAAVDLVVWSRHEHDAAAAARVAAAAPSVVLTAGPDAIGVWWEGTHFDVSPPTVSPDDATGSGDVFAAACSYGLAAAWGPGEIIEFAAAAGAAAAAMPRAGLPSLAAIDSLRSR